VVASAVLLPIGAYIASSPRRFVGLATALAISCGSALVFHVGYRQLTGRLAGREAAYHYRTGSLLVAVAAPLVRAEDTADPRVAEAVLAQSQSRLPLANRDFRAYQMWSKDGFVARLGNVFHGDLTAADEAGGHLAHTAILRDPLGFITLGGRLYLEYWMDIGSLGRILPPENGTGPIPAVTQSDVRMVSASFGDDVSNQQTLFTPSRRYHLLGGYWNLFLLASPFLGLLALWNRGVDFVSAAWLAGWSLLLMSATCLGAGEVVYRYLVPFSFTGLAATAAVAEAWGKLAGTRHEPVLISR